jgi:hypothetical protein
MNKKERNRGTHQKYVGTMVYLAHMTRFQKLLDLLFGFGAYPKETPPNEYTFTCPTHGKFTKQKPNMNQRCYCGKISKMNWNV